MKIKTNLILLILIFSSCIARAQEDLKIGLVLSGGGAKCLAQVGAIQVIEEAGIEFDYIGGTSMGAIIGAMYSLGFTGKEMEEYLRQVDWDALLANEVPRNRLSYFDRKSDDRYFLSFPVDSNGVSLPSGVNFAQYILRELSTITQQSYQYEHFSDFPIPFFCVATNLESGNSHLFEEGRLIDALRASSAFPSLFTPYQVDDSLYIDGGVVLNYPVRYMAEKDMDYIIGIDLQNYLRERDDLNSIIRVLEQTTGFLNSLNQSDSKQLTDILISPGIDGIDITSFDKFEQIVESGRIEARKHLGRLKELAQRDQPKNKARKEQALPFKELLISSIKIIGNKSFTPAFVLGKLRVKEGQITKIKKIERGLDRLYGSTYFETVDYSIEEADSSYRLIITLKENTSQQKLKAGINYSDDYRTSLLINYTHRGLLFKNSRLSIDLALGDMPRGEISYFVDRGFIPTLGIKISSHRFRYQRFVNLEAVNQRIFQDYSLDLFIQSTIRDAYAIGGGVQIENVDISQDYERADFTDLNKGFINYYGYLDFDSFDDANFPHSGFRLNAQYRIIAERIGFETFLEPSSVINLKYEQVIPLSSKLTFIGQVNGINTIGPGLDLPFQIYLGSMGQTYANYIQSFVGHRFMELTGRNLLSARVDINYEIVKNHFLLGKVNYAKLENSFEEIFNSPQLLDGYSIGYAYNSLIGPLEVHFSTSTNHANYYTYVRLGFWF